MRSLKVSDIFALGRCVTKLDIKEDIKKIAKENDNIKDVWEQGYEILWSLFEKVCAEGAEKPIYDFLAGPFECDWKEVRDMDPLEWAKKIKEVANVEEWKNFFQSALKMIR